MIWLDLALGLLSVVVLVLAGVRLYRHVRSFFRTLGERSSTLADASAQLNVQQTKSPSRR